MSLTPFIPLLAVQLILATIALVLHVTLAYVVYRSAEEHGMSPIPWAVLYFFTGPIGWIIFQLARDAGFSAVSDAAPASNPARQRVVDQRDAEGGSRRSFKFLPRPSDGFSDHNLEELISSGDWSGASAHVEEMTGLAKQDGNTSLADDYHRLLVWIDAKQNPWRS
jgi:hypothetical protein